MFNCGIMFIQTKFIAVLSFFSAAVTGNVHFKVKTFKMCDGKDYKVQIHANFTEVGEKTIVDADAFYPMNIGDNTKIEYNAEILTMNNWIPILAMKENNACLFLTKYCGQMWHDIERAMGIQPKMCPLIAGRYRMRRYAIDWNKLKLQSFPKGQIRMRIKPYENENLLTCVFIIVENE